MATLVKDFVPRDLEPYYWDIRTQLRSLRQRLRAKLGRAPTPADSEPDLSEYRQLAGTIAEIDGVRLSLDPALSDRMIRNLVCRWHSHIEIELIQHVLKSDDVVMELGGGIGVVAINCARAIGSDRVFSYEANPTLAPIAAKNFRLNGVQPSMEFCMLGERSGEQDFFLDVHFDISSAIPGTGRRRIRSEVRSFAAEVARILPTFLIVDIEGGECELFRHADLSGIQKIMLETHVETVGVSRINRVRRRIRKAGFREETRDGKHFLYFRQP